jgi:hypothetical protein
MPAIHPMSGGINGSLHAVNFEVVDYNAAITIPAKIIALTLIDLLSDNASAMKYILENNQPLLSKEAYRVLLNRYFS